jgi:hypothetical protein
MGSTVKRSFHPSVPRSPTSKPLSAFPKWPVGGHHRLDTPIQAKKQYLIFDGSPKPKLATKEGTIPDALHLLDF